MALSTSSAVRNARPLVESPAGWALPVPFSYPGNGAPDSGTGKSTGGPPGGTGRPVGTSQHLRGGAGGSDFRHTASLCHTASLRPAWATRSHL